MWHITLRWRHNECDGISNPCRLYCLLNRLFRRISLAFVRKIHWWSVGSPHKGPVTRIWFLLMTSSWWVFGNVILKWHPGNHMTAPVPVTYESGTVETPSVWYIVLRCSRWLMTGYRLGVSVASGRVCWTNWGQTKIWYRVSNGLIIDRHDVFKFEKNIIEV